MGLDLSHSVPSLKPAEFEVLDYFTVEELSISPDFIERHKDLLVEIDDEELKMKGLYLKDKGYQRKGMSSKFYEDFECGRPYFDLQSVEKAYEYLEADHIKHIKGVAAKL